MNYTHSLLSGQPQQFLLFTSENTNVFSTSVLLVEQNVDSSFGIGHDDVINDPINVNDEGISDFAASYHVDMVIGSDADTSVLPLDQNVDSSFGFGHDDIINDHINVNDEGVSDLAAFNHVDMVTGDDADTSVLPVEQNIDSSFGIGHDDIINNHINVNDEGISDLAHLTMLIW